MGLFKKLVFWFVLVVALAASGGAYYFYKQYVALKPHKPGEETAMIIAAVGRLIVLPANEQPTIATVSDPERLKDQPFFANAKTGDKVLIYALAKKAILYDPEEDKIVEVAPLDLNTGKTSAKSTTKK